MNAAERHSCAEMRGRGRGNNHPQGRGDQTRGGRGQQSSARRGGRARGQAEGRRGEVDHSIRSPQDAERFLRWIENREHSYEVLEKFTDNADWDTRIRELFEQYDEPRAAEAMKRVIAFLLGEQLQKPLYDRQIKQMLLSFLRFPRIVFRMLRDFQEDSQLTKFCRVLGSMREVDEETREKLEQLRGKLENKGDVLYVEALDNDVRREVLVYEVIPTNRHDNDCADFREIQICPTESEIKCADPYLPDITEGSVLMSDQDLAVLDSHFRLLREDFVGLLREELVRPAEPGKPRCRTFPNASIVDFQPGAILRDRPSFTVNFDFPEFTGRMKNKNKREKVEFWESHPQILPRECLVCLRIGSGESEILCFGVIVNRKAEELAQLSVQIHFEENSLSDCIALLHTPKPGELICVCSSYFAYEPVLRCLQQMDEVPLADELIRLQSVQATCEFDLHRIEDAGLLEQIANLDGSQRRAFDSALEDRVSLIQGPPGTGKTYIGTLLARAIYHSSDYRLMCVCYTNHALDQFLEGLLDAGIDNIVRIGGGSKNERLNRYNFEELRRQNEPEFTSEEKSRYYVLKTRMETLRPQLTELSRKIKAAANRQSWAAFRDYLEQLDDDRTFRAFLMPNAEDNDNFQTVGRNGRALQEDFLWLHWLDGKAFDELPPELRRGRNPYMWKLNKYQRQHRIKQWSDAMYEEAADDFGNVLSEYMECAEDIRLLKERSRTRVLHRYSIIGATTSGAAKYKAMLRDAGVDVLLVEEASEVLEAHLFTALTPTTKHLIMIGDHEQLRPKVENYELTMEAGHGHALNVSTFERMIKREFPYVPLLVQHRMRPEISSLVRRLVYPDLEDHASVLNRPQIRGLMSPVVFCRHTREEDAVRDSAAVNSGSHQNQYEIEMVEQIVRYLTFQGYTTDNMVVLTPYLGQLFELRKALSTVMTVVLNELDVAELARVGYDVGGREQGREKKIRVATVDNFQGEEADIVIISLVRSNAQNRVGFLDSRQRVNVLLSRARHGMIIVGNESTLLRSRGKAVWKTVMDSLRAANCVFDGVPLVCPVHGTVTLAASKEMFPTHGGCSLPCNAQLPCGHQCGRQCHLDDRNHNKTACSVRVHELCVNGHPTSRQCSSRPNCKYCRKLQEMVRREEEAQKQHEDHLRELRAEEETRLAQLELERKLALQKAAADESRVKTEVAIERAMREYQDQVDRLRAEAARKAEEYEQARCAALENIETERRRLVANLRKQQQNQERAIQRDILAAHAELQAIQAAAEQELHDTQQQAEEMQAAAREAAVRVRRQVEERKVEIVQEMKQEEMKLAMLEAEQERNMVELEGKRAELAAQQRQCCVCFEDVPILQGVLCRHPEPAERHFLCGGCFNEHALHSSLSDLDLLERRGGKVPCGFPNCPSPAFDDVDVYRNASAAAIEAYRVGNDRLREKRIVAELDPVLRRQIQAEMERQAALDEEQRAIFAARRHIIEKILTSACPRCSQAFLDFDGCCALTCNRCACGFCAYCLADCGHDAHAHVARCQFGIGTFASFDQWQQQRRIWMNHKVQEYLDQQVDANLRARVAEACRQEFVDLQLNEILQRYPAQAPPPANAGIEDLDRAMALQLQFDY